MNYKAFYRTYRPSNFDQVVGQDHIVRTLINLIKMNKISHGYLFCGPRGTGKTSIAKIFANAINCIHADSPEKICKRCLENSNNTLDIIEIDAASNNSVNDVRTIREQVEFAPTNSPYKIYIIDEVHMLSKGAFNALLMTLEEPPAHAIFILATTDPDKIPDTILSRVQRYNFKKISKSNLESQLKFVFDKEKITYDPESIEMIVSLAGGSLRDALSIADQINAYSNSNIKINDLIKIFGLSTEDAQVHFLNLLAKKSVSEALQYFEKLSNNGVDINKFILSLVELLKDNLVYKKTKNLNLVNHSRQLLESIIIKNESIYKILDILIPLLNDIKYSDIPNQLMQLAIIKICSFEESLVDLDKKDHAIESLNVRGQTSKEIDSVTSANKQAKTSELEAFDNKSKKRNSGNLETKDITDEYFAAQNVSQPIQIPTFVDQEPRIKIEHETKTLLGEYSKENIENSFNNLVNDFSSTNEINRMRKNEQRNEDINATREIDLTGEVNKASNLDEKIIDQTTELLNLSNEMDGSEKEVDESLLQNYETSKETYDTNEIHVGNKKINFEEQTKKTEQNQTKEYIQPEATKEFIIQEEHQKTTPIRINSDLTQPKIVNLFLLSKKDTFDIFKQKLELSSCVDKDEYDSFAILLKEVRFICSSNDFILVSSSEDWVINDINKNFNDPKFKAFISEYFGNNVHFYAITKKDYIVSKELYAELKKSGKMLEPKPLEPISHVVDERLEKEEALNEIETKAKSLFSNIFSRKKE